MKMYAKLENERWLRVKRLDKPVPGARRYILQVNPKLHDGKRTINLGDNFEAAVQKFQMADKSGNARNLLDAPVARHRNLAASPDRLSVADAATKFVADTESKVRTRELSRATLRAYRNAAEDFAANCGVTYMDEITADVLNGHKDWLRENIGRRSRGKFEFTLANRFLRLSIFLKRNGIKMARDANSGPHDPGLLDRREVPKFPQVEGDEDAVGIRTYLDEDINAMLKLADVDESDLIQFGLFTGFRAGEISAAEWRDIDWTGKLQRMGFGDRTPTIITREKETSEHLPEGFRNKSKKSRFLPLPLKFVERLKARQARSSGTALIFPNGAGKQDKTLYDHLNAVLDRLAGSRNGERIDGKQGFHRFRKTYATKLLAVSDIYTVKEALGHADIKTTLRYLGVNRSALSAASKTAFVGIGD